MTNRTSGLDQWLAIAEEGFHLIPLNGKATARTWDKATTDPRQIAEWARTYDTFGLLTYESGLIVIDIDQKPEGSGFKALGGERLERMVLNEQPPIVLTPSGGWHIYYRAPEGSRVASSVGKPDGSSGWLPYVDIRAGYHDAEYDMPVGRGMIVAPGSHRADKGVYEQIEGNFKDIPTIPQWLYDELKVKPRAKRRLPQLAYGGERGDEVVTSRAKALAATAEGEGRNDTLSIYLRDLVDMGLFNQETVSIMEAAALFSGMTASETAATIRSATNYFHTKGTN